MEASKANKPRNQKTYKDIDEGYANQDLDGPRRKRKSPDAFINQDNLDMGP